MPWEEDAGGAVRGLHRPPGLATTDCCTSTAARSPASSSTARATGASTRAGSRRASSTIADLVAEASHWARHGGERPGRRRARRDGRSTRRRYRSNLIEERMRELIAEGTLDDRRLRASASGRSTASRWRSSATTSSAARCGSRPAPASAGASVVNIDRETELSGPIHDKGFLILAGLPAGALRRRAPAVAAGEPRLRAELRRGRGRLGLGRRALRAALEPRRRRRSARASPSPARSTSTAGSRRSAASTRRSRASSRSASRRVSSGDQGVRHPGRQRQAPDAPPRGRRGGARGPLPRLGGRDVDEGIELLTGVPAGERGADGGYPEGTIHRRIEDRLAAFAAARREFGHDQENPGGAI